MMLQRRALVVDNDPFYVELLAELLAQEGYETLKAYDGLEALELAEQERPDLIFLDIVMPKVDGDRVCQYLKENSLTQQIP
ncbi:MAG: response regulator, partial [Candidatus Methylomirabilales bacterium]